MVVASLAAAALASCGGKLADDASSPNTWTPTGDTALDTSVDSGFDEVHIDRDDGVGSADAAMDAERFDSAGDVGGALGSAPPGMFAPSTGRACKLDWEKEPCGRWATCDWATGFCCAGSIVGARCECGLGLGCARDQKCCRVASSSSPSCVMDPGSCAY